MNKKKKNIWTIPEGLELTEMERIILEVQGCGKVVPTRALIKTSEQIEGIQRAGVVNTGLHQAFPDYARRYHRKVYIPKFSFTTDNAAMIGIVDTFKYKDKDFCPMDAPAYSRVVL